MLTTSQKAVILAKAGVSVPPFPARSLPVQERYLREGVRVPQSEIDADQAQRVAAESWRSAVENLYTTYVAARAAKSLRQAEEADSLARLRGAL